jgi:hypothetical protein
LTGPHGRTSAAGAAGHPARGRTGNVRAVPEPRRADAALVRRIRRTCRSLRAVWIDAGSTDEYHLDFGAVAFRRAVTAAGVADDLVGFELFDGGHGAIEYRYPPALAWLTERLTP